MIPLFKVFIAPSVDAPLLKILHSGYIGQGRKVEEFEAKLRPWVGTENVLALNSGTSALQLALRLAGVGHGSEVISTPMTCTATNMAILAAGARIRWADVDPVTGNIDPATIPPLITVDTRAIMCVDFGGYPCNLADIMLIAMHHEIPVIEDAAHAFGGEYQKVPIGAVSDFTCFSFQAIKALTTVDGGALACLSQEAYKKGKLLRWYGIDRETPRRDFRCEDDIGHWGYKFHMNDVNATIGLENIKNTRIVIAKHQANAKYYNAEIEKRGLKHIQKPKYKDDRRGTYWLYPILVENAGKRLLLQEYLEKNEIQSSQVHKRNDVHSCFVQCWRGPLPGVEEFSNRELCIPIGWWVTLTDRRYIMDCIEKWDREQ